MDGMNDLGLLKSKVFGGFDKKSVFSYFESISKKYGEEKKEQQERIDELEQLLDEKKKLLDLKNKELAEKDSELEDTKKQLQEHISNELKSAQAEAVGQLEEQKKDYEQLKGEYDKITSELEAAKEENVRLKSDNDSICADFRQLSEIYKQLDKNVSQIEQSNVSLKSANDKLSKDVTELSAKLDSAQSREQMLMQSQQQTDDKLNTVSAQLNDYMQNCTCLQRMLDEQDVCLNRLKGTVSRISNMDFSAVEDIQRQVGNVIDIISQIKSAVGTAMLDCRQDVNIGAKSVLKAETSAAMNGSAEASFADGMDRQRRIANEILSRHAD